MLGRPAAIGRMAVRAPAPANSAAPALVVAAAWPSGLGCGGDERAERQHDELRPQTRLPCAALAGRLPSRRPGVAAGRRLLRAAAVAAASATAATASRGGRQEGSTSGASSGSASASGGKRSSARATVGRLFRLLLPDSGLLGLALAFLVLAAFSQALTPHFLSKTLRVIIDGQNSGTFNYTSFFGPLRLLLLAGISGSLFASLRGACFIAVGARASIRLRKQLFNSLLVQDIGFFDVTKTGEITARLNQDCQKASDQVTFNLNIFSRSLVQLITTLCFMTFYSWELTLVAFVTVPISVLLSKKYGDFMRTLSEATSQKLADANAVAEEALSSVVAVRSFAGERAEAGRFGVQLAQYRQLEIRRARFYVAYLTTTLLLPQLGTALVLLMIGRKCVGGMDGTALLAFIFYLQTLNDCFGSLADFYTNIVTAVGSATRVFELIDRPPAGIVKIVLEERAAEKRGEVGEDGSAGTIVGRIAFSDVHFSYPARPGQQILCGLSLECPPGKVVALVGPSGGGKSTCISLLERFYEPQSGSVTLDGRDVREYDHEQFHELVSIVGQEPTLFGRSVRENILYGLPDDHPARQRGADEGSPGEAVLQAARLANAHGFISAMPDGYDSEVGERGVQLSGGQKQRVAIARALVRQPRVLLLDEATSALDAESEMQVQSAINNLIEQKDLTVVIVAHRLSTVQRADKICVIQGGIVAEQGTHQELMLRPEGSYRQLVRYQLQGLDDKAA